MANREIVFGPNLKVELPDRNLPSAVKLYIAGPQGFMEATRPFHDSVCNLVQQLGAQILDPWKLTDPELIKQASGLPTGELQNKAWQRVNRIIGENNTRAIIASNGLIANLDGTDVDSGTAAEIGAAFILGKPILGYRGDLRLSADNPGARVNLQVEYCIRQSGDGRGTIIDSISQMPAEILRIWGD